MIPVYLVCLLLEKGKFKRQKNLAKSSKDCKIKTLKEMLKKERLTIGRIKIEGSDNNFNSYENSKSQSGF